jgi:hypothetical protein
MSMLTVRDLDPEVKDAAAVETSDEPVDLVASIRKHFSGGEIELELPDRTSAAQRPITFGS